MMKEEGLKDLIEKYEKIVKRIEDIPKEIITVEKRAKEKERDLDQVLKDIESVRKERQSLLVVGGKVNEVSARIKMFWERCDLIEDEIIGIKGRIRELHDEEVKILEDKNSAIDEIVNVGCIPLVENCNTTNKASSDAFSELFSFMKRWGIPFGLEGWGRFISPSSWIGLKIIPRLFLKGENVGDDFFNLINLSEKENEEKRKEVFEKLGLLK